MRRDIVIAGTGGQGSVLASRLIAHAAISEGLAVRTAETIGMAQRGGSVLGYVRVYDPDDAHAPLSPIIGPGQADLLIAFEPAEAARSLPLLKPDGWLISAIRPIVPVPAQLARDLTEAYDVEGILTWLKPGQDDGRRTTLVDGQAILSRLGSSKVLNVVLLGVAIGAGSLGISEESLVGALNALIPKRLVDLNLQALQAGKEIT